VQTVLSSLLLLCLSLAAYARPISLDDATLAAQTWLQQEGAHRALSIAESQPLRASQKEINLYLHRFHPTGFLLMSADDALPPVLGYSLESQAPRELSHPAVAAYLQQLHADLMWARSAAYQHPEAAQAWYNLLSGDASFSRDRDLDIEPMIESLWDQGPPWNHYCPPDSYGPGGRVWVGCVAVAMGQIMYYWQDPLRGRSSYDYLHPVYGGLSADFGNTVYDWDAMHPTQGNEAAALLLYHAGIAVHMDYGVDGSGAFVGNGQQSAMHAMRVYFRFPESLHFEEAHAHPGQAWPDLLHSELEAGRPILHRGYGSGGHAFNIDGWHQDDYFHLNWGWSGSMNGWFLLEALSPGGMDFSVQQGAILGMEPNSAPTIALPDLEVAHGQAFPVLDLDLYVDDAQTTDENIIWWSEGGDPIDVTIDYATRQATLEAPAGWVGSALLTFCAIDLDNLSDCDEMLVCVLPPGGDAQPALPISDLQLQYDAQFGARLSWSVPETDTMGYPVQIVSFDVYGAPTPWFTPSPATLLGSTTEPAFMDLSVEWGEPRFYRIISRGP
jgi:hypothetical protein